MVNMQNEVRCAEFSFCNFYQAYKNSNFFLWLSFSYTFSFTLHFNNGHKEHKQKWSISITVACWICKCEINKHGIAGEQLRRAIWHCMNWKQLTEKNEGGRMLRATFLLRWRYCQLLITFHFCILSTSLLPGEESNPLAIYIHTCAFS